jgi:hypothetical protein
MPVVSCVFVGQLYRYGKFIYIYIYTYVYTYIHRYECIHIYI